MNDMKSSQSLFKNKKVLFSIAAVLLLIIFFIWFFFFNNSNDDSSQNFAQQCGSTGRTKFTNKELSKAFKSATDNIPRTEVSRFSPEKLIDGNKSTFAYPNGKLVDYSVNLTDLYEIDQITIVWNEYGEKEIYVRNWLVEGCDDNGNWKILDRGGWPQSAETNISANDEFFSEIRLRAEASDNWIGIYEIEIE